MSRKTLRRNHRKVCVGDMRDRVTLQDRDITEPAFGDAEFGEAFAASGQVWAKVVTTAGKVFFDGVNTDMAVTHEVTIRYDPTVTAETWIELADGRRLDIVNTEDLEERQEYLRLLCTDRGSNTLGATAA